MSLFELLMNSCNLGDLAPPHGIKECALKTLEYFLTF